MGKRRASGEGTIFFSEKENLWVADVSLPDGKRKRKRSKSQKVVKGWLLTQRDAIRDGTVIEKDQIRVGEFIDRYMTDVAEHTLRPKTLEAYNYLIRMHIKPEIGDIRLTQLRPENLQSLYSKKLNSGLSHRTVQFIHSVIHKALEHAGRWGLVVRNVADLVDPPSVKRKARPTFTVEELNKFLDSVKGHRWEPIYLLAAGTGLREGELLGLRWQDVSLETGIIQIQQAVQYLVGKGLVFTEPKSETSRRPVVLPNFAIEALKQQREYQGHSKQSANGQWQETGLVFTTSNGTPISPRNLIRHFKNCLEKSGLPDIRFHDFSRHTHASLLLAAGVHPKIVQERLGHSQISLTMDTYSHTIPSMQTEAASKIGTLLKR